MDDREINGREDEQHFQTADKKYGYEPSMIKSEVELLLLVRGLQYPNNNQNTFDENLT